MNRFEQWRKAKNVTDEEWEILQNTNFIEIEYNKNAFRNRFFRFFPRLKDIEKFLGRPIIDGIKKEFETSIVRYNNEEYVEPSVVMVSAADFRGKLLFEPTPEIADEDLGTVAQYSSAIELDMMRYMTIWSTVMTSRRKWHDLEIINGVPVFRIYKDDMLFWSRLYPNLKNIEPLRVNRVPYYTKGQLIEASAGVEMDKSPFPVFDWSDNIQMMLKLLNDTEGKSLIGNCVGKLDGGNYSIYGDRNTSKH